MITKEAYKVLEPAHFLKDIKLTMSKTPEDLESRRRLADFSRELDMAIFMLAMSFKQPCIDPYLDLFEEKDYNNVFKHNYYRQCYLYSALIWYQNAFDMFIQSLWFYHHIYHQTDITTENYKEILANCTRNKVIQKLFGKNKNNPISQFHSKHQILLDAANKLKHRQFLENDAYLQYPETFTLLTDNYNSDETKTHVHLEEVQNSLLEYHKDIIQLAKDFLLPIYNDLNSRLLDNE